MQYKGLRFWVEVGESRNVGVFPENAAHWDWIAGQVEAAGRALHVLNLFGYTGLATLAAARAGARVTHVDAAKRAVRVARENQALSGLEERPVRWLIDDALKFLHREARRGVRYEGIIMDPPAFGRGPQGEVWEFDGLFSALCAACRAVLSDAPLFVVLTAYVAGLAPRDLTPAVQEMMRGWRGSTTVGELVTAERSAGRVLPNAIFARWNTDEHG